MDSKCIETDGLRDRDGYALTGMSGLYQRASRVAYCDHHKLKVRDIKGKIVRHKCDNRACINPLHLELGTQLDNVRDMIERGRFAYREGEAAPNARLTEADVLAIRERKKPVAEMAKQYGLSRAYVYQILSRKVWTNI